MQLRCEGELLKEKVAVSDDVLPAWPGMRPEFFSSVEGN